MDSNKKVQSFLTPTDINGLNGIWNTMYKRSSYPDSYVHPFPSIFSILNIAPNECSDSESESEEEEITPQQVVKTTVKTVTVQTPKVETRTIGTQYSINDFDDWIFVKDKNT